MAYETHTLTVVGSCAVLREIGDEIHHDDKFFYGVISFQEILDASDESKMEIRYLMPSGLRTMIEQKGGKIQ